MTISFRTAPRGLAWRFRGLRFQATLSSMRSVAVGSRCAVALLAVPSVLMLLLNGCALMNTNDDASASNLLPNPGFERQLEEWRVYPEGRTGIRFHVSDAAARSGVYCGQITVSAQPNVDFVRFERRVPLPPEATTYTLSAWVRSSGVRNGLGVYAGVTFHGEDERRLRNHNSGPDPEPIDPWTEVSVSGVLPGAATVAIVRLIIHGEGEVFWDDAVFTTGTEGARDIDRFEWLQSLIPESATSPDDRTCVDVGPRGTSLGELGAFWRTIPRPDANMDVPRRRAGTLIEVPSWLAEHPRYRDWEPSRKTVLFADTLSTVRLLGGWNQEPHGAYDLAVRREDRIEYRWELLHGRLGPWVSQGLDALVVLDNVPFCFVSNPAFNTYGQVLGPDDAMLADYGAFIRALTEELVAAYGRERVAGWRFRVGTEPDLPGHWEDTVEKYCMMYDYATAAVLSVLPEARVGPGNFLTPRGQTESESVQIMEHIARGRNYATGAVGSPIHFLAGSLYATPRPRSPYQEMMIEASPEKVRLLAWKLKMLRDIDPRFRELPIEMHEFGTLYTECARNADEKMCAWAGMRGAAWVHQAYAVALEEGFSEVFFWFNYDMIPGGQDGERWPLLRGYGWLRGMLEYMDGGAWSLPRVAAPDKSRTTVRAFASRRDDALWIALSAFSLMREHDAVPVRIAVDRSLLPAGAGHVLTVREYRQTMTTWVYDVLHADLARRDMLAIDNGAVYRVPRLTTPEGMAFLRDNAGRYQDLLRRSFQPAPFAGTLHEGPAATVLETTLESPSVLFLEVRF